MLAQKEFLHHEKKHDHRTTHETHALPLRMRKRISAKFSSRGGKIQLDSLHDSRKFPGFRSTASRS
jgi:hypothetical protein